MSIYGLHIVLTISRYLPNILQMMFKFCTNIIKILAKNWINVLFSYKRFKETYILILVRCSDQWGQQAPFITRLGPSLAIFGIIEIGASNYNINLTQIMLILFIKYNINKTSSSLTSLVSITTYEVVVCTVLCLGMCCQDVYGGDWGN